LCVTLLDGRFFSLLGKKVPVCRTGEYRHKKALILVAEQLVWCGYDIYLASTKLITERNTIVDTRASWRERDENISHLVSLQVKLW